MDKVPYSQEMINWITLTNNRILCKQDAWLIMDTIVDPRYYLRFVDGMWVMTSAERGENEDFIMSAYAITDIERYLTVNFGDEIRRKRNLPIMWWPTDPELIDPQSVLITIAPDRIGLVGSDDNIRTMWPGPLGVADSIIWYSWLIDQPVCQIQASYLAVDGEPLFPDCWIGPAGKKPAWAHD
jgi:hypothetical protein